MKNTKQLLSLLICAVMIVTLVACNNSKTTDKASPDKEPATTSEKATTPEKEATPDKTTPEKEATPANPTAEEITLSVAWWGGDTRNARVAKTLEMYSAKNPQIKFSTATNNFSDHGTAMSTAAASGDLPDMWLISTTLWMGRFVESGQLLDLRPYIESGAIDVSNIPDANLESGRAADGGIYAIASGLNTPCIQYNKTLLEEHGIEIKNGMTIDDFISKCDEIYKKTGRKTTINNPESFIEYLLRADGKLLYGDGKIGADSPEDLMTYFNLMERGRKEGWLIDYETYVTKGGDASTQPVVTGVSWNAMWNSNQTVALQSPCPEGVILDMVTWPTPNLEASGYTAGAMAWCIPANTEHPDEAVALLNWWVNSPEVHEVILGELGIPVNTKVAEHIIPFLDDTSARAFKYVLEEVVPHSSPKNPIGGPGAAEVRALIDELEEMMYYGSITPKEAAERLFTEGNALLAK
ncbi:extracellular solute-binding protein [Clostridiales bacterium COT073_COT-073]|nr:extracellular solute-binding protein [Clostridiales bacterium COT073_COT-073]